MLTTDPSAPRRRTLKTPRTSLTLIASLFATVATLLGTRLAVHAAPGDLDLTFNGTGYQRINIPGGYDDPAAVAIQEDGKTVAVGWTAGGPRNCFLVRFNTDGTPDASFGNGGKVITIVGEDGSRATGVKMQADGKIVVCGYAGKGGGHDTQMIVMRYLPDGSLDTTFSGDGIRYISVTAGGYNQANGLVIQADGKIVLCGRSGFYPATNFAVVRLNADSSLDTSFARDGTATLDFDDDEDCAEAVALQGDGKIVLAGWSKGSAYHRVAVARCTAGGVWDTGFGDGGKVVSNTGLNSRGLALALQNHVTGTRIVVAGYRGVVNFDNRSDFFDAGQTSQMMMLRYQSDGDPDTTFSGDGMVLADFLPGENVATAVFAGGTVTAPTLLMTGFSGAPPSGPDADLNVAAARFTNSGLPDTSFGGDGTVTTGLSANSRDVGLAAAQADGKITILGTTRGAGKNNEDLSLTRLHSGDGTPDTTFNFDGVATMDVGPAGSLAYDLVIQGDGRIVVAGAANSGTAVARVLSDGGMDSTFNFDGIFTTDFPDFSYSRAYGMTLQSDGKILFTGSNSDSVGISSHLALGRVTVTGSADFGFGDGGKVTTGTGEYDHILGNDMAVTASGSIYVAGISQPEGEPEQAGFMLALYNAGGDLMDLMNVEIGNRSEARDLAVQKDGKIVVAGLATFGAPGTDTQLKLAVARFVNQSGKLALDRGFGAAGIRTMDLAHEDDFFDSIAIDAQGRIILAGTFVNAGGVVVRLTADGDLDNTFSGDGRTSPLAGVAFHAVALQKDGMILAAGNDAEKAVVARFQSNGSLNQNYGVNGVARADLGAYSSNSNRYILGLAVDAQGRAVIAGGMDGMVVARLRANLSYTGWAGDSFQGLSQAETLATADPDRDGVPNGVEFMLHSDPLKPTPHPVEIVRDGSRVKVAFSVRSDLEDAVPEITFTENLETGNWQVVPLTSFTTVTTGDVTRYELTPPTAGSPSRFYRLGARFTSAE